MLKTVNLNGAETRVDNLGGYHVSIKNHGSEKIYASAKPNIVPGEDGVLPVCAGESAIYPCCKGIIYLKGSGMVSLAGTIEFVHVFT